MSAEALRKSETQPEPVSSEMPSHESLGTVHVPPTEEERAQAAALVERMRDQAANDERNEAAARRVRESISNENEQPSALSKAARRWGKAGVVAGAGAAGVGSAAAGPAAGVGAVAATTELGFWGTVGSAAWYAAPYVAFAYLLYKLKEIPKFLEQIAKGEKIKLPGGGGGGGHAKKDDHGHGGAHGGGGGHH